MSLDHPLTSLGNELVNCGQGLWFPFLSSFSFWTRQPCWPNVTWRSLLSTAASGACHPLETPWSRRSWGPSSAFKSPHPLCTLKTIPAGSSLHTRNALHARTPSVSFFAFHSWWPHRTLNSDSLGTWRALLSARTLWPHLSRWAWFTLGPWLSLLALWSSPPRAARGAWRSWQAWAARSTGAGRS